MVFRTAHIQVTAAPSGGEAISVTLRLVGAGGSAALRVFLCVNVVLAVVDARTTDPGGAARCAIAACPNKVVRRGLFFKVARPQRCKVSAVCVGAQLSIAARFRFVGQSVAISNMLIGSTRGELSCSFVARAGLQRCVLGASVLPR